MIELERGQVWQVPDKKWIRVRVITDISRSFVYCVDLGDTDDYALKRKAFLRWIKRNKLEKPIGICNFKTGKVRAVK